MAQAHATRRLQTAVRIALAAIFLYAAATKALRSDGGQVPSTIFAEWSRSTLVRHALIGGEAGLAVWMLSGVEVDLAGVVAMAILSVFTGLVILELVSEHPKPCGCSGTQAVVTDPSVIRSSLRFDLTRNVFMMAGAAWLYVSVQRPKRAALAAPKSASPRMPGGSSVPVGPQSMPIKDASFRRFFPL
ncbi:MAG: MauE/DoxX family redox-associated membrane protein [Tepidisphaeraceae bacterium]|jgi:uncharacterized membrane protein YphA (DoxX/SURF4 family)